MFGCKCLLSKFDNCNDIKLHFEIYETNTDFFYNCIRTSWYSEYDILVLKEKVLYDLQSSI